MMLAYSQQVSHEETSSVYLFTDPNTATLAEVLRIALFLRFRPIFPDADFNFGIVHDYWPTEVHE